MYGEDARTIAELSIDDYLYPDADLYNVSGLPPLALPPTCDLSRGHWVGMHADGYCWAHYLWFGKSKLANS